MDLEYRIVRSPKRKKLTITVERDRTVVVHAPETMSDDAVSRIVKAKRQWLVEKLKHPQKYQNAAHPPGKELVSGESAPYLGRDYRIEITETDSGQIEFAECFHVPPSRRERRSQVLRNWYIERANELILARVKQRSCELGIEFHSVKVVDSRYRWGSCTAKDNLHFNWRLIKAPMFVIDYVVVHELTHFIETNHTPRFWSIIRAITPSAEKAKRWLKENGQILEQEI